MDHIWDLLAREETKTLVLTGLGLAAAFLLRLRAVKAHNLERAVQCVEAAVRATYEEYVRAAKTASPDGKLTPAQRNDALRQALGRASDYARAEGIDLLKHYAANYLPVVVEKVIGDRKAAALPFAPVPWSGLPPAALSDFSETATTAIQKNPR